MGVPISAPILTMLWIEKGAVGPGTSRKREITDLYRDNKDASDRTLRRDHSRVRKVTIEMASAIMD
jgi:hypothetical protein